MRARCTGDARDRTACVEVDRGDASQGVRQENELGEHGEIGFGVLVEEGADGRCVRPASRSEHDARHGVQVHAVRMYVAAMRIALRIPQSNSLKAKRSVVRHLVELSRRRFGVSASEVAEHDRWQLAVLGFAVVAPSARRATELLDLTERFVWSHPEVEVVDTSRHWVEVEAER